MKILLTGASGRIGRALHGRLARDHDVTGVDLVPSEAVSIVGSISDEGVLRQLPRTLDAVIHAAALHAPHVGLHPDAEFEAVNVAASRRLLEIAADAGARKFV